jgi:hypothetical protein
MQTFFVKPEPTRISSPPQKNKVYFDGKPTSHEKDLASPFSENKLIS